MTDDDGTFELSRRKALAGLGTIGVASAGAGLGTSAFFSDTETFSGNQLTAGELDLLVDWEEHYSDWSEDEDDDGTGGTLDIQMPTFTTNADGERVYDPAPAGYVGLPNPANPLLWVAEEDVDQFQDNTSIEALPDDGEGDGVEDDGIQDEIVDPCGAGSNLLNGASDVASLDSDLRTESSRGEPLIQLDDVKPGDFGEATLSLHLCDNPGYIWMFAQNIAWAENGENEPEGEDPDSVGPAGESGSTTDGDDLSTAQVELLDAIQTMFWYDEDGDNVYEPGGVAGQVDVSLVLDVSGSMDNDTGSDATSTKFNGMKDGAKTLINELDGDDTAAIVPFETEVTPGDITRQTATDSTGKSTLNSAIDALSSGGNTNVDAGLVYGGEEVTAESTFGATTNATGGRAGAEPIVVLLSDGIANESIDNTDGTQNSLSSSADAQEAIDTATALKSAGVRIFTIAYNAPATAQNTLQDIASPGDFRNAGDIDEIQQVFAEIARSIAGEKCFLAGSLRETLGVLNSSAPDSQVTGVPLDGNRAEGDFVEVGGDDSDGDGTVDSNLTLDPNAGTGVAADSPTAEGRDCYVNSTTNAIGFAWWLPVDHANEIQSDSVSFDLGFYTEQCRHNEGAGQAPEA